MSVRYNIVSSKANPSVPDVLDSFARAYEAKPRVLEFTIESSKTLYMSITAIAYESGSPGMFLIEGSGHIDGQSVWMKGYYNANDGKRSGWVEQPRLILPEPKPAPPSGGRGGGAH